MADNARIESLRRRVAQDPASIAFAQLAEEYRRAGQLAESVECCRAGLARHPSYVSARVTLGRALFQLGDRDQAQAEFEAVLKHDPDNLAAIRGLAELCQLRGDLGRSLDHYTAALSLARHDPELEQAIEDLTAQLRSSTRNTPSSGTAGAPSVEPPALPSASAVRLDTEAFARAARTIAALEQWLAACHVARSH